MVEVEVVHDSEAEGTQGEPCCVPIRLVQRCSVLGLHLLKVPDEFAQEHWLDDLNSFLVMDI